MIPVYLYNKLTFSLIRDIHITVIHKQAWNPGTDEKRIVKSDGKTDGLTDGRHNINSNCVFSKTP